MRQTQWLSDVRYVAEPARIANLLSASRFVLGAAWLVAFVYGARRPEILGSIALSAAISDFVDGRVARRTHSTDAFGRWLDNLADVILRPDGSHV